MWESYGDFVRVQINRKTLAQIEASLHQKRTVQFHALGASRPRALKFVFDFHLPGQDRQLSRRRCLFQIYPVVNDDTRLQMRDVNESRAQRRSSSPTLSWAACTGHLSKRRKIITTTAAIVSAISVNATGHENACWRECLALGVEG